MINNYAERKIGYWITWKRLLWSEIHPAPPQDRTTNALDAQTHCTNTGIRGRIRREDRRRMVNAQLLI